MVVVGRQVSLFLVQVYLTIVAYRIMRLALHDSLSTDSYMSTKHGTDRFGALDVVNVQT